MNPENFDDISEAKKKEFTDFEREVSKHSGGNQPLITLSIQGKELEVMCSDGTRLKIPEGYKIPDKLKNRPKTDFVGDEKGNIEDLHPNK